MVSGRVVNALMTASLSMIVPLLSSHSIKTVQNLRRNKFKINILSGDRKQTVLALAKKIGCKETEVKWDLLPHMKLKIIENLK